jgi:transcriptional regulator with XRE-family HTH domain
MEHAGTTIRITREAQGLSLRDLAERSGTSFSYLSRVERGVNTPTDRWLRDVTRVLANNMHAIRGDVA